MTVGTDQYSSGRHSFGDYGYNNYDNDTLAPRVVASCLYAIEDPKDIFDTFPIPAYDETDTVPQEDSKNDERTDNSQLV